MAARHALEPDALRGNIDLSDPKASPWSRCSGLGLGLRIQQISKGQLEVNQGSLLSRAPTLGA